MIVRNPDARNKVGLERYRRSQHAVSLNQVSLVCTSWYEIAIAKGVFLCHLAVVVPVRNHFP